MKRKVMIAAIAAAAIGAGAQASAQAPGFYNIGWGRTMIVQRSDYAREFASELERPGTLTTRVNRILQVAIAFVPNIGYQRALNTARSIGYYGPYWYFHGQSNRIRHCSWNGPKVKTYMWLGVPYWSDPAW